MAGMRLVPRLRFSLRTLLVIVTLLGLAMAWVTIQLKWISDRHQAVRWLSASKRSWYGPPTVPEFWRQVPWSLRIFGEQGVMAIGMDVDEFSGEVPYSPDQLKSLFPECHVDYVRDGRFIKEWQFKK